MLGLIWRALGGVRAVVPVLAMASAAVACGEEEGIGGGTPAGTQLDAEIESLAAAQCEARQQCQCANASSECVDERTALWRERIEAGEDRGLVLDTGCLEQLAAAVDLAECEPAAQADTGLPLCASHCAVYYGTVELGAACSAYDELVSDCTQGLLCEQGTCVDPCQALSGVGQGMPCMTETGQAIDRCADGLFCDWNTYACQALATAGESCFDRQCAPQLWCNWEVETCVAAADVGQSCTNSECMVGLFCDYSQASPYCKAPGALGDSCVSINCEPGLWCDGGTCSAPAEIGAACPGGVCVAGGQCDFDSGLCVAAPGEGSECLNGACASGLWCDFTMPSTAPVCRAIGDIGDACMGHTQCESLYCPVGFCEARPAEGEDCTLVGLCQNGLVCDAGLCRPTEFNASAACVYPAW